MVSSGLATLDGILGGEGYPEGSAILVAGAPGIGKEALGYWFVRSGLIQGDFCLYVTRLSAKDVIRDAKGFGVEYQQKVPLWMAGSGGQVKYDPDDLSNLSYSVKNLLNENRDRRIRIVTDIFSTLLMVHPPESIYKFSAQLIAEVKEHNAVLLALLEDGMHSSQVNTAMHQLFDGVVEFRIYEEGLRFVPILRITKMIGLPPQPGYYNFSFTRSGMELSSYAK